MSRKINISKKFLKKEYIENKKSTHQIAEELGCGATTIKRYLKKFGISARKTKNLKREKHPNWKGGKPKCIDCGKEISYHAERCDSCSRKGPLNPNHKHGETLKKHYCKESDCNNEISYDNWRKGQGRCKSCAKKGKLNSVFGKKFPEQAKKMLGNKYSYVHGRGYEPYSPEFNEKLKLKIRTRDNYTCQNCGMTEEEHIIVCGQVLEGHHINYDKQNCKETNLITLCKQCNMRANFNRDYWQNYYNSKITEILTK